MREVDGRAFDVTSAVEWVGAEQAHQAVGIELVDAAEQRLQVADTKVAGPGFERVSEEEANHDLSEREVEILEHVAHGAINLEISESLMIAENTVKVHMHNILGKLRLRNRQQAAAYALRTGIVSEDAFRNDDREEINSW